MKCNRLICIGLIFVVIGWGMLLPGAVILESGRNLLEYFGVSRLHISILNVSNGMIVSGFGLAILGTLKSGFCALREGFEAMLKRSQAHMMSALIQAIQLRGDDVAEEGWMGNRAYVRFVNGTIQIETLLGKRKFSSFDEAREFIGS